VRLKNTFTNQIEPFEPLDPASKTVTMYSCGPTVYGFAHIGNFRSFLFADVLRRSLERKGYNVRQVMNITDVGHMTEDHLADAEGEDKLAKAARELGSDPYQVANHFENAFIDDARTLRLRIYGQAEAEKRELHPQATRHVAEMLAMINKLLERGYAYADSQGQIYYDISKFPEYGALSGKDIDELEEGARVEVRSEKRDPRDFALWKVDAKHLMQWDPHSPTGWPEQADFDRLKELVPDGVDERIKPGFPGWHIECSAMIRAHLGDSIDIHTGGEDNIFPHHECEVAQSYGAVGNTVPAPQGTPDAGSERKTFARYWVHGRHLLVDNKKMSKRDGTFFTVKDLLDPRAAGRDKLADDLEALGFTGGKVPPVVLRLALISVQYIQPMNFTLDSLGQARANIERMQSLFERLSETAGDGDGGRVLELAAPAQKNFGDALDDNLNVARALAETLGFIGGVNKLDDLTAGEAQAALAVLDDFDSVFAVIDRDQSSGLLQSDRLEALAAAADGEYDDLVGKTDLDGSSIEKLLALRAAARKNKDWGRADAIRDKLAAAGVTTADTPDGVRWKK